DFYGATELGWVTLVNGEEMVERPRTVGRPIAGQNIRILDERGEVLKTGETGTVYVKNDQTMSGYLNDAEATDQTKRDGWMSVDDTGWLDEDGYLYLSGRKRDMAIVGGMNVYPMEIEECLAKHEFVLEVAVVGVADDELGERLIAVVVVRNRDAFNADTLIQHAREQLSAYKVPKRVEIVDQLPRNPTGKVLKQRLREQFASR
ncbi:MAG: long-chain fatty acid--CoA ligase, partial [Myxococcales bacterium]|nr:long-chain fatty acid--CoA ligase [Myxococcales bacterium]